MLFTIITPTYNAAPTLLSCIESVAQQSHPDFEHLIMDGGSTDGTVKLLTDAMQRFPRVRFVSEKDHGIYDAMNKGVQQARGDYIHFLGADDRLTDPAVLSDVAAAIRASNPSILYGNVRPVGGLMNGANHRGLYAGPFNFQKLLLRNICHQAIFYSREIVARVGPYNRGYRMLSDWDYNLRCFAVTPFTYLERTIADYYVKGSSATDPDWEFFRWYFKNLDKYFGLSPFDRRLHDHYGWLGFAGVLHMRSRRALALTYFGAACWHSPAFFFRLLKILARPRAWFEAAFLEMCVANTKSAELSGKKTSLS